MMTHMGQDFVWFQGVVEDRNDPLKLGRIRVRCLGWHPENKQEVPTESLPWAHPIQSINSAAMNGIGISPTGPVEGTWVFGFFRDGNNAQEPVIIGTLGGIPEEHTTNGNTKGFRDPNNVYPKEDYINEPDTHRRARNENVVKRTVETTTTAFGATIQEPPDPYDALYPKNHTRHSESGHLEEWDDTPDNERLLRQHKSGTFEEIHPDGTRVSKISGDSYTIVSKGNNVWIKGSCNLTIDNECRLKTPTLKIQTNDLDIETDTYNLTIKGESHYRWEGDRHYFIGADTYERHDTGKDHSCTSDPIRTSGQSCDDVESTN